MSRSNDRSGRSTGRLIHPLTGEELPGDLSVSPHALRHLLEEHPDHPHEQTLGLSLAQAMRDHYRTNPHADLPAGLLAAIEDVLLREVAASLARGWAMLYCMEGKQWWKMVVVLRSGAMVPLLVGDEVRLLTHYFRTGSLRDSEEGRRAAAGRYLVNHHCPRCPRTGRPAYPAPWHMVDAVHAKRGNERRYHIRFGCLRFFGFGSREPGTLCDGPDVRLH